MELNEMIILCSKIAVLTWKILEGNKNLSIIKGTKKFYL